MTQGLPVKKLINVNLNLTPGGAQFANFDELLIVGDSDVIDTKERIRRYAELDAIASDFGTSAPEYLAAQDFFSQVPQPDSLLIGRWAQSATHGLLVGGVLTAAQQAIANWTAVANGGFHVTVDAGDSTNVTGIDLSAVTTLDGVAATINTALTAAALAVTCVWDAARELFEFKSTSTGAASQVSYLTAPLAGTDLSVLLLGTAATASYRLTGVVAESAADCAALMDGLATPFYGFMFASTNVQDDDHMAVAAYFEGSTNPHLYGVTSQETAALLSTDTTSIGYQLKQKNYRRTFVQFSSSSPYAVASMFGRLFTVDPAANNSTITLMYKNEPGVIAETLTEAQAAALDANNYNYFAVFNNNTSIIVNGWMADGTFIDTVWGCDWLANQIQTDVYNLLYTSPTKVPQTDPGNHLIATTIEQACAAGGNNGLLAPGQWNSAGFGQLKQGDFLSKGYYVYAPPIATQAQSDRAARKSVTFQVAAKLAGAIHDVAIAVNVNQ